MLRKYLSGLYQRTMKEAYQLASHEIVTALGDGGNCLDCGAHTGYWYNKLSSKVGLNKNQYHGIEWDLESVEMAQQKGLNVQQGDLNKTLPYEDNKFTCIFALSLLEHLLNPCHYLKECRRILKEDGKLVLLTPNISTFFTAFLILSGRMPSSGPHPDSEMLIKSEDVLQVDSTKASCDIESDTPIHRHLVVFSFLVLRRYLKALNFTTVKGYGFGLYPFPNFMQPVLEQIDPYHCHQMVFIAQK